MGEVHECAIVKALVAANLESCLIPLSQEYPNWWNLPSQDKVTKSHTLTSNNRPQTENSRPPAKTSQSQSENSHLRAKNHPSTGKKPGQKSEILTEKPNSSRKQLTKFVYYTIPFPKSEEPQQEGREEFVNIIDMANSLIASDLYNRL